MTAKKTAPAYHHDTDSHKLPAPARRDRDAEIAELTKVAADASAREAEYRTERTADRAALADANLEVIRLHQVIQAVSTDAHTRLASEAFLKAVRSFN